MFSRIFNAILCHSSQDFVLEMDEFMRDDIKRIQSIKYDTSCRMMENLDDIKIDLDTYKKNIGIENVKKLDINLVKFLYDHQSAIPFGEMSYIRCLQPNKYWFKNGFRIKTEKQFRDDINQLWVAEAVLFLNENKKLIEKILDIYSVLDYSYQHPDTYNRNDLKKWKFKMNKDGTIQHQSDKVTLERILSELIMFQEGLYNDTQKTRQWGLYNSSFYNAVLFRVFGKIIEEIITEFRMNVFKSDNNTISVTTLYENKLECDYENNDVIEIKLE